MSERSSVVKSRTVLVCTNFRYGISAPSCSLRGGQDILSALQAAVHETDLPFEIKPSSCLGRCSFGPTIRLERGEVYMGGYQGDITPIMQWLESLR